MAAHARLGPSSASRWINCPGSIRLTESLNLPYESNEYAELGTAAHDFASKLLEAGKREASDFLGIFVDGKGEGSESHIADEDMCTAVQVYLDVVWGIQKGTELAEMGVEKRVKISDPDVWGTLDCSIAQDFGDLHIIDYKHGAGVVVDAVDNPQLKLYAIGCIIEAGGNMYDDVYLHIVQPRAQHADGSQHRVCSTSADELLRWWTDVAEPAAKAAVSDSGALAAGDHCKWCDAKGTCNALNRSVQASAQVDFATAPIPADYKKNIISRIGVMTNAEMAEALTALPLLKMFEGAVKEAAVARLSDGKSIPGYKLVRSGGNRIWTNKALATKKLAKLAGGKKKVMVTPELLSPAKIEALGVDKAAVAGLCHKPEGGLAAAKESSKKQAVLTSSESAYKDFATNEA